MAKIAEVVKLKSGYANFVELKSAFEAAQENGRIGDRSIMFNKDRSSFLERLAVILEETQTQCYVYPVKCEAKILKNVLKRSVAVRDRGHRKSPFFLDGTYHRCPQIHPSERSPTQEIFPKVTVFMPRDLASEKHHLTESIPLKRDSMNLKLENGAWAGKMANYSPGAILCSACTVETPVYEKLRVLLAAFL